MHFPIFPLNGAILFPGTNLPLNIFEKKYIQMVDFALSNDRLIGMIQKKENGDFFKIGCLGRITSFSETSDSRYQINLEGVNRFKYIKIIKTDYKFITINGTIIKSKEPFKTKIPDLNKKLLVSFKKYLEAKKIDFDTREFEKLDSSNLAKIICVISPLDNLTKQMLLEFDTSNELCENLLSVLEIEMKNLQGVLKAN